MDDSEQPMTTMVRRRGRPRRTGAGEPDQAVGREALIDATIELLKTTPPAQITPIAVTRALGVHSSLIRYYFNNRASLLVAVARTLIDRFGQAVEAAAHAADDTPAARLCARIGRVIDLNASFPHFHQLIVSEIAESADPIGREMIGQLTRRGTTAYASILRGGLADGSFRGMDPALLYVVVVGMAEFFNSALRQLEIAQGGAVAEEEARAAYKAFVCDLVLNGVRVR